MSLESYNVAKTLYDGKYFLRSFQNGALTLS